MPLRSYRVLVLEDEYLIALEIGRILEEAHIGEIEVARNLDEAVKRDADLTGFNAAIVEIKEYGATDHLAARRLLDAGVPVIFGTVFDEYRDGVPGFPDTPVVLKPYATEPMVEAVLSAVKQLGWRSERDPA